MSITCTPHEYHMHTTWLLHVHHMGITCTPHGTTYFKSQASFCPHIPAVKLHNFFYKIWFNPFCFTICLSISNLLNVKLCSHILHTFPSNVIVYKCCLFLFTIKSVHCHFWILICCLVTLWCVMWHQYHTILEWSIIFIYAQNKINNDTVNLQKKNK